MNKKIMKNQGGFTLVELLVVIAIIGILAVTVTPALFRNINKARVAKFESVYQTVKSAALSYYSDKDEVPRDILDLISEGYIENLGKSALGGEYRYRAKNKNNKIMSGNHDGSVRMKAYIINKDGSTGNIVPLDQYGDAFFGFQGMPNDASYLTNVQFKKLVEDIGHENIFLSSSPSASTYKYTEIYIRIINNVLPKPELN